MKVIDLGEFKEEKKKKVRALVVANIAQKCVKPVEGNYEVGIDNMFGMLIAEILPGEKLNDLCKDACSLVDYLEKDGGGYSADSEDKE